MNYIEVTVERFFKELGRHENWLSRMSDIRVNYRDKNGNMLGFVESVNERECTYHLKDDLVNSYNYL